MTNPHPLRPDWYDKPLEEWPEDAKEFYRLLYIGQMRANAKKALENKAREAADGTASSES